jgi:hypothetical protein
VEDGQLPDDSQHRKEARRRAWPRGARAAIAYMFALGVVVSVVTEELVIIVVMAVGLLLTVAATAALMRLIGDGRR